MAPVKKILDPLGQTFLKEWREAARLNQDEAANRIGISRALLSKMEAGKSPYTQRTLEKAAAAYGCTPAQLLSQNPADPDSFVVYFEIAERSKGDQRKHLLHIIAAAVGKPVG